jgi:hypothetical protein
MSKATMKVLMNTKILINGKNDIEAIDAGVAEVKRDLLEEEIEEMLLKSCISN